LTTVTNLILSSK